MPLPFSTISNRLANQHSQWISSPLITSLPRHCRNPMIQIDINPTHTPSLLRPLFYHTAISKYSSYTHNPFSTRAYKTPNKHASSSSQPISDGLEQEESVQPIVTVDKWGIQHISKDESTQHSQDESTASPVNSDSSFREASNDNLRSEQMMIFELSKTNFHEVTQGQGAIIIEAYMNGSELSTKLGRRLKDKVHQYQGTLRLARLNATVEEELTISLKLTQVPTLIGVYGGKTVASFVGYPDESSLQEFLDVMLQTGSFNEVKTVLAKAKVALESDHNVSLAKQIFTSILQAPNFKAEAIALAGLARCSLQECKHYEAQQFLDIINNSFPKDLNLPDVIQARTALELAMEGSNSHSAIELLKEKVQQDPDHLETYYDLATSLWAQSKQQDAIDVILELIKRDREWNNQMAKVFLLKIFQSLGPDHPMTIKNRRRFSNLWFS